MGKSLVRNSNQRQTQRTRLIFENITTGAFQVAAKGGFVVRWGDGTIEEYPDSIDENLQQATHTYDKPYSGGVIIEYAVGALTQFAGSVPSEYDGIGTYFIQLPVPETSSMSKLKVLGENNSNRLKVEADYKQLPSTLEFFYSIYREDFGEPVRLLNFDLTNFETDFPNLTYFRLHGDVLKGDFTSVPPNLGLILLLDLGNDLLSSQQPQPPNSVFYWYFFGILSFNWTMSGFNRPDGQLPRTLFIVYKDGSQGNLTGSWNDLLVGTTLLETSIIQRWSGNASTPLEISGSISDYFNRLKPISSLTFIHIHNSGSSTFNLDDIDWSEFGTIGELTIQDCPNTSITGSFEANNPINADRLFIRFDMPSAIFTGNVAALRNVRQTSIDGATNFNSYTMPLGESWRADLNLLELQGSGGTGLSAMETDALLIDIASDTNGPVTIMIRSIGRTFLSDGAVATIQNNGGSVTLN